MTITLELPDELERAVEAEARRRGISVQAVVLESVRKTTEQPVPTFPVFEGGVRLPHQTVEWCDNIRDVAYDEDDS